MRHTVLLILAFAYTASFAQSPAINYTPQQSYSIHDSIRKSRWDVGGELSKYSFRYMHEFFPTAIINKPANAYTFRITPNKSIGSIPVKTKSGSVGLEAHLKQLHLASFIVVQKGAIVYEKYFSMLPEDQHSLQSVSKVITSTLITSLINEGRISIDNTIEKYIPELTGSDWQGISVRDILNMRSGMDSKSIDFETGPFTNPQHKNYQLESALGILPKAANTPESVYTFLKSMKKDKSAGVAAEYSNINTFVLGWLAEKVTNKKYADLVTERIWQPMGATSNAYVCLSEKGIAWPHGGISATLRDLARFGMLYTNSEIKNWNERLVSSKQLKEIFDAKPVENSMAPFNWTYQWDIAVDGLIMKSGFGGQALYIHPRKEIVIAYYNYVDSDWGMNLVSDAAIIDIIKILN